MNSTKANILTDQFGRVHDYLRISLTERCNLRCTYCMPAEGIQLRPRSQFMNTNEVLALAQTFVDLGVTKIRLTGGEPLVRNDAREVIEGLAKLPVSLAISTNGILVDKFIDTFKAANLNSINISLDSLREEKFNKITRRENFKEVLSNIHLLLKENFHVKLNAVIMKGLNEDEIVDFVEFTKHNKVHFRFIEFMPFNGNNWDWSKGFSYKEVMTLLDAAYGDKVEKLQDSKNDTAKSYKIKNYAGTFAVISSVTNPFCDSCNRLRLTADGKLKNCLFSQNETDLLSSFRDGKDIKPLIFESVWKKKSTRGGMESFEDLSNQELNQQNRSMITIGG